METGADDLLAGSRFFSRKLFTKWRSLKGQAQRGAKAPRKMLSEAYRIPPLSIERLWGALPELLVGWWEPNFDQRAWVSAYPATNLRELTHFEGVLLCHSPTPTWDSAALLGELGRSLRISRALRLPLRVMLAGNTWARFNWVVMDLKAEANLDLNFEWRKSLYGKLGIDVTECQATNLPGSIPSGQISILATEYSKLASAIWGAECTRRRLTISEAARMVQELKIQTIQSPDGDLLDVSLVKEALSPHTSVLKTVLTNLRRLDRETFLYFFLQYFHQSRYHNHLKLAVTRERAFDEPFRTLDIVDLGSQDYSTQASIYFSDYYFDEDKDASPSHLTVHPYYFPSGSLYTRYATPSEARSHCLMVEDEDSSKIQYSLDVMYPLDRARFLADLLSFAHWFGRVDKRLNREVGTWFKSRGMQFSKSWEIFAVDPDQFAARVEEWGILVFSKFADEEHLPYYCLPFVWEEMGVTRQDETSLVQIILHATTQCVPVPKLLVEPN